MSLIELRMMSKVRLNLMPVARFILVPSLRRTAFRPRGLVGARKAFTIVSRPPRNARIQFVRATSTNSPPPVWESSAKRERSSCCGPDTKNHETAPSSNGLETGVLKEIEELLRVKSQQMTNLSRKIEEIEAENTQLRDQIAEDARSDSLAAKIQSKDDIIEQMRLKIQEQAARLGTGMASVNKLRPEARENKFDLLRYHEIRMAHDKFIREMEMRAAENEHASGPKPKISPISTDSTEISPPIHQSPDSECTMAALIADNMALRIDRDREVTLRREREIIDAVAVEEDRYYRRAVYAAWALTFLILTVISEGLYSAQVEQFFCTKKELLTDIWQAKDWMETSATNLGKFDRRTTVAGQRPEAKEDSSGSKNNDAISEDKRVELELIVVATSRENLKEVSENTSAIAGRIPVVEEDGSENEALDAISNEKGVVDPEHVRLEKHQNEHEGSVENKGELASILLQASEARKIAEVPETPADHPDDMPHDDEPKGLSVPHVWYILYALVVLYKILD